MEQIEAKSLDGTSRDITLWDFFRIMVDDTEVPVDMSERIRQRLKEHMNES